MFGLILLKFDHSYQILKFWVDPSPSEFLAIPSPFLAHSQPSIFRVSDENK